MHASVLQKVMLWLLLACAAQPLCAQQTEPSTMTVFGDLVDLGGQLQIRTANGELLEFAEQPLMNWSNPTRNAEQSGSIFIWHRNNRPQVIGSIFTFVYANQARMKHELHSLAKQPLEAEYRDQATWKPSEPGIHWNRLSEGGTPHSNARRRLVQMRAIARQFSATLQEPDGSRTRLELKPTPLHRYASEQESVLDGAIFSFAHGTDPEVLMLVEAIKDHGSGTSWQYAFARFHYWNVSVADSQGAIVWTAEQELDLQSVSMGDAQTISRPYISYHVERRQLEP